MRRAVIDIGANLVKLLVAVALGLLILSQGCQTAPKYTSIREVIELNDTNRLRQLLEADPRLITTASPLYIAVEQNRVTAVKLLLDRGADANIRGPSGDTPLILAAGKGETEVVRLLLATGANPNARDRCAQESPLDRAIKNGHTTIVTLLLATGGNVNNPNSCGNTPLHQAALTGDARIMALLLASGADVNSRNRCGATALHLVADNGRRDLARLLIAHGADVNARDVNQLTALHWAACKQYDEMTAFLLAKGTELDLWAAAMLGRTTRVRDLVNNHREAAAVRDGWGLTVLHRAAQLGHRETMELLLAEGANINAVANDGATPLTEAAVFGNPALAEFLISKGADPDGNNKYTSLHTAAYKGHVEMIKWLLGHGAEVNAVKSGGITPLHWATEYGHIWATEVLLKNGAYVNAQEYRGLTALHLAVEGQHCQVIDLLLRAGADTRILDKQTKRTALEKAAASGYLKVVKCFVSGARPACVSPMELKAALRAASQNQREEVVLWLLHNGVSLNAEEKWLLMMDASLTKHTAVNDWVWHNGFDPNYRLGGTEPVLVHAATYGRRDLVQSLLKHGAAINACDVCGDTALARAIHHAEIAQFDLVNLLLDAGADVNSHNDVGLTPLHRAAMKSRADLVKRLISLGASVNAVDDGGKTPLHWAIFPCDNSDKAKLQLAVVKLLLEAGADVHVTDKQGRTALDLAVQFNTPDLVPLLRAPTR